MASLSRKSCRLFGCCHILKRENKILDKQSLNVSPVRFFNETWGEVKVQQNQKHSQENFLLELIKYNKKLVNSKDTFYMINYLLENKLYEDENMVAFNKPVGFPMTHNAPKHVKNTEMVDHVVNLNGLIPHLAERLFCRNLYVALPLDRMCSGVIILAKSEDYKDYLKGRFYSLKNTNQYPYQHWDALCVGIPDKLPVDTEKLYYNKEKFKDIYLPQTVFCKPNNKMRKKGELMHTSLSGEIIAQNSERGGRSSHVRMSVTSASNHVIPAYLSERFAPVLGDQEYFWRAVTTMGTNITILRQIPSAGIPRPQELSKGILSNLGIKQGHVQSLPLFLHRSMVEIVFHKKTKKDALQIKAPLSDIFLQAKYQLLRDKQSEAECVERFSQLSRPDSPLEEAGERMDSESAVETGERMDLESAVETGEKMDSETGFMEWEQGVIQKSTVK